MPERDPDLDAPDVFLDEVEALFAADLARPAEAPPFWPDFDALDLEAAPADLVVPLRAGDRDAVLAAAPFDAAPFDPAPDFEAEPDFEAALFELAPDLDAPLFAADFELLAGDDFIPVLLAPAPVLLAAFLLLALAPFAAAAFLVPPDAPPELEPDLRDFVVLSAITRLLWAFA